MPEREAMLSVQDYKLKAEQGKLIAAHVFVISIYVCK